MEVNHMSKLSMIEGIGETYEMKLNEVGVNSVEELLKLCSSKKGRSDMAEKTGITEKLILKWANHADLFRVKGIAGEYAELLEASGVDTIPELKQRNAENLFTKMVEVNEEKKLVRNLPTQDQVEDWVKQAGDLPRILEY
jgi:predicted flap endonuclease-1-like 5' DNA nuclease